MTINCLHIASFSGNIGDNANHKGFYNWFRKIIKEDIIFHYQEIREFYWGEKKWNIKFIEFMNSFDFIVIGGGNFFELWVENSPSGTSIGIDPKLIKYIKKPVFFNALGVDPGQGVPNLCKYRFKSFLDEIFSRKNFFISLRNDGAIKNISEHIGLSYSEKVFQGVDNGFFAKYRPLNLQNTFGINPSNTIAINIASDMSHIRFKNFGDKEIGFIKEFSEFIKEICYVNPTIEIVLVPHIFRDLEIIYKLINVLGDRLRRTRIRVAGYSIGNTGAENLFGIYKACKLSLGMRFHSNVLPLAFQKNTLGLSCYPQIDNLYNELNLSENCIKVSSVGFKNELLNKSIKFLDLKKDLKIINAKKTVDCIQKELVCNLKIWLAEFFEINE